MNDNTPFSTIPDGVEPLSRDNLYGEIPEGVQPLSREEVFPEGYEKAMEGSVDDRLKWKYGDAFDATQLFGDGVADALYMTHMGRFDTNDGRKEYFERQYPEGELLFRKVGDDEVALGKKNKNDPNEKMRRVSFWQTDVPAGLTGGAAIGATLGTMVPGVGPLGRIGLETLGAAVGGAVEEAAMSQVEPGRPSTWYFKGGLEGGIQFGASLFFQKGAAGAVVNQLLKSGDKTDTQQAAFDAWLRQNMKPMGEAQFSTNPMMNQIQSLRTAISEKALTRSLEAYKSLGEDGLARYVRENGWSGVTADSLNAMTAMQAQRIADHLAKIGSKEVSYSAGAKALNESMENYWAISGRAETMKYNSLRARFGHVEFDLEDSMGVADDILNGVKTMDAEGSLVAMHPPSEKIRKEMEFIKGLNPVISTRYQGADAHLAVDQMMAARNRMWDLYKTSDPGSADSVAAKRMWGELTKAIENPIGGDKAFTRAWKDANDFYAFNRTLEDIEPVSKLDTSDPFRYAAAARKLQQPDQADQLLFLHEFMNGYDPAAWETFRNSFITDLMDDPVKGLNKLGRWSHRKDALNKLMTPDEQRILEEAATMKSSMDSHPVFQRQWSRDTALGQRAIMLSERGSLEQLDELIEMNGGLQSDFAKSMRAGVVKHWLQQSSIKTKHIKGDVIDILEFQRLVKQIEDSGRLEVLFGVGPTKDRAWLDDILAYATILGRTPVDKSGKNVGASIISGEQSKKAAEGTTDALENLLSGEFGNMARDAYKIGRLPLGIELTSRFLINADRPVKEVAKKGKEASWQAVKTILTLRHFLKEAPVMAAEMFDNDIQYADDPIITWDDPATGARITIEQDDRDLDTLESDRRQRTRERFLTPE